MPALSEVLKPFLLLKCVQFLLGLFLYGLFYHYLIGGGSSAVGYHIMVIAVVAYPFIVVPSLATAFIFEQEAFQDSIINLLLSFCGFLVCLVGGIVATTYGDGAIFAGIAAIIISLVFLVDVVIYSMKKFKK